MAKTVSLDECPIGLFYSGDELCVKTEYGSNEGRIDAYIVGSGEMFWGEQPQSIASQRASLVVPVDATATVPLIRCEPCDGFGWVGEEGDVKCAVCGCRGWVIAPAAS